jgi:hypothetical protein
LDELWTLWELVLLGEPILVKSSSPRFCSKAVFALIDLITPLRYGGDFRPYNTIHDPDMSKVFNIDNSSAKILGVTNPVVERTCEYWPHHLVLGQLQERSSAMPGSPRLLAKHGPTFTTPALISRHKPTVTKDKKLLSLLKDEHCNSVCK